MNRTKRQLIIEKYVYAKRIAIFFGSSCFLLILFIRARLLDVRDLNSSTTILPLSDTYVFPQLPKRRRLLEEGSNLVSKHNLDTADNDNSNDSAMDDDDVNDDNNSSGSRMRILYVITSSNDDDDRFNEIVKPIILEATESLIDEYDVDIYLVLGYTMSHKKEKELQSKLPKGVGLEIWNDAGPIDYACDRPFDEEKTKDTMKCVGREGLVKIWSRSPKGAREKAMVMAGDVQLARQHRYVVKDKFPYYDFFMAFEDDMMVTKTHVQHHLQIVNELNLLKSEAPDKAIDKTNFFWGEIPKQQLDRMRPGFIRVEVLSQKDRKQTQKHKHAIIPIDLNFTNSNSAYYQDKINSQMFQSKYVGVKHNPEPKPDDVLIWETRIEGMSVRQMPTLSNSSSSSLLSSKWIAMLPGPLKPLQGYNAVRHEKRLQGNNNGPLASFIHDPQLIAQSAGWMATQEEILYLNKRCIGGFLPPFDMPEFPRDGYWKRTVEFWSGGIQLWCRGCGMQRIILLENPELFTKHLMYHTSNNKQFKIHRNRLVLGNDFLGQLNALHKFAIDDKNQILRKRGK